MKKISFIVLFLSTQVMAHSGGTNSSGCHHETRTGGYHCHRSDDSPKKDLRTPASTDEKEAKTEIEEVKKTKSK